MTTFVYDHAKGLILSGSLDFPGSTFKVMLLMEDTSANLELSAAVIDDFTTLDEYDGDGYDRKDLLYPRVKEIASSHASSFAAEDVLFEALGASTRNAKGLLVYKHVTDDSDSIPIAYLEPPGFPFAGDGTPLGIMWDPDESSVLATSQNLS